MKTLENKTFRTARYTVQLVMEKQVTMENAGTDHEQIGKIIGQLATKDREHLICIWLNARHKIIGSELISVGTLTASLAHPREILKGAILAGAAGIVIAHNHPSGNHDPSEEDIRLTKRLSQAANIIGIDLLDHYVVSMAGCYSFKSAQAL